MKIRLGIIVGIFMAFLSLYPQFYFQIKRGESYNGATFHYDFDESAYASYLQALIDGRPRKNSIYQGSAEPQTYETLFSIQFISSYLTAIPARVLGIDADKTFLIISVLFAFLASLAVFSLLLKITENEKLAAVGTLFILLFGANAAGASILKETLGFGASAFYLTFLRRFTPAVAFPFIFVLINCVWLGLKTTEPKRKYLYALIASLCFAGLVFGYFFFWTAILVWIGCLFGLHFLIQKENRNWSFWLVFFAGILFSLIPYFWLLSERNPSTDASQVMEYTRKIVLLRPTLIVGLFVLLITAISVKLKWLEIKNQTTILIISLAILPLLVFNQQIITGRSLQPMHYNMYILNYLVLLALVLLIGQLFKEKLQKLNSTIWIISALIFCVWGIIETNYTVKYRFGYNQQRDEAFLVNKRLAEIGKTNFEQAKTQITFNFDSIQSDNQPTIAPQGVLWADHLYLGGNLSDEEHQRRYFLFLYFQSRTPDQLRQQLQFCPNEACRALIGWRTNPTLSYNSSKIESAEIDLVIEKYSNFIQNISVVEALNPQISYLIVPNNLIFDSANFDRWYQKEKSEQFGRFTLYYVKPIAR